MTTPTLKLKRGVKAYSDNGEIVAEFYSIKRQGDKLIIDGKALGVMRMDMLLPLGEILRSFGILFCWATVSFVLLLPYFGVRRLFGRLRRQSETV